MSRGRVNRSKVVMAEAAIALSIAGLLGGFAGMVLVLFVWNETYELLPVGGILTVFVGSFVVLPIAIAMRHVWLMPNVRIASCPKCGYDLRAHPERRCPECGWNQ